MKTLPNLFAIAWALAVVAGFYLSLEAPVGADAGARAMTRLAIFGFFEGAALLLALFAVGLSLRRGDPRGSKLWWMGWGPLIGMVVIGSFVGLAAALFRAL